MKARGQRIAGGFTLIEVLVSFSLVIMIVGIGALSLTSQGDKKRLIEPASELKAYARRGLQLAISNRRPFAIGLRQGGFALHEANVRAGDDDPPGSDGGVLRSYELDEDMRLELRRWGEKHFRAPEGDVWVFEPSGICEPLAVRLYHPEGVIEMEFNPLTAKIAEQSIVLGAENIDDF